jgi:hypothetical protein
VASSNTTQQRDILQNHGAAWHPSTPRSIVASFNTTEQRGIIQHHGAAWHPSTPRSSAVSFKTTEQHGILRSMVLKDVILVVVLKDATPLHGVE